MRSTLRTGRVTSVLQLQVLVASRLWASGLLAQISFGGACRAMNGLLAILMRRAQQGRCAKPEDQNRQ